MADELGIDADLGRADQRLTVRTDNRRYGKAVTIVEGFDTEVTDAEDVASELKRKLACGGTVEDDEMELQGDHRDRVGDLFGEREYAVEG